MLRIACRSADWPMMLEDRFRKTWPDDNTAVYEIAPLRRQDIVLTASESGIDPDSFLHEVVLRKAAPLAMKPITLRFLITAYQRAGGVPKTQVELYREGCRILCEEMSSSRMAAKLTGDYSAEQRFAVSARIAALLILCNRVAVTTSMGLGYVPVGNLTISDLASGVEKASDGTEVDVTQHAVREAIRTALFSSRGSDRLGFAHQSFAEFLAAQYLTSHHMTTRQIMRLLVHPEDGEACPATP